MNPACRIRRVDRLVAERKSILDFVGKDLERFRDRLGAEDQMSVTGHLESIRALEKQLAAPRQMIGACGGVMWSGDPGRAHRHQHRQHAGVVDPADAAHRGGAQVRRHPGRHHPGGRRHRRPDHLRLRARRAPPGQRLPAQPGLARPGPPARCAPAWPTATTSRRSTSGPWASSPSCSRCSSRCPRGPGPCSTAPPCCGATTWRTGPTTAPSRSPGSSRASAKGYFKTGQCLPNTGRDIGGVLAELCAAMDVPVPFFGDANTGKPMPELRAQG